MRFLRFLKTTLRVPGRSHWEVQASEPRWPGFRLSHAGAPQLCLSSLWGTGWTPHCCFNLLKAQPTAKCGPYRHTFKSDSRRSVTGIWFFALVLKTHTYIFKIIFQANNTYIHSFKYILLHYKFMLADFISCISYVLVIVIWDLGCVFPNVIVVFVSNHNVCCSYYVKC